MKRGKSWFIYNKPAPNYITSYNVVKIDKLLRCVNAFIDRRVFFGFDVCYFMYTVSVNYDDCIFKSYWRTHRVGVVSSRPQPHPTPPSLILVLVIKVCIRFSGKRMFLLYKLMIFLIGMKGIKIIYIVQNVIIFDGL